MKYNKILFVGHSLSSFAPNILKNLGNFSSDVCMFDHYSPDFWAKILGLIRNKFMPKSMLELYIKEYINNSFMSCVQKYQPDLIFLFKGKNISSNTLRQLRSKGYVIINWYPDYYDDWSWISTHADNYDYFFTPCEFVQTQLKKIGITAFYVPFAAEPDLIYSILPKKYQVTFVGRYTERRNKLFKKVYRNKQLDIWGYYHWQKSAYKNVYHGELTPTQTLEIIRSSKITLNTLTGTDEVPIISVNYRVFEATGAGGFVLSSYHAPLEKFFRIGKEVDIFDSAEEASAKTKFYLKHDSLREKVARAGWERTKQDHTYQKRLQKLFSYIK